MHAQCGLNAASAHGHNAKTTLDNVPKSRKAKKEPKKEAKKEPRKEPRESSHNE